MTALLTLDGVSKRFRGLVLGILWTVVLRFLAVAIRMILTALPITSAGGARPWVRGASIVVP